MQINVAIKLQMKLRMHPTTIRTLKRKVTKTINVAASKLQMKQRMYPKTFRTLKRKVTSPIHMTIKLQIILVDTFTV